MQKSYKLNKTYVMARDKFIDLEDYLKRETRNSFYLTFDEIEEIIGQPLCYSAYKYVQYWRPCKTHVLPNMIYNCGFAIDVDLSNRRIKLYRQ